MTIQRLARLWAASQELDHLTAHNQPKVLRRFFTILARGLGAAAGQLVLQSPSKEPEYRLVLIDGQIHEHLKPAKLSPDSQAWIDRIMDQPRGVLVPDISQDQRWSAWAGSLNQQRGSLLATPFISHERALGVLMFLAQRPSHFTQTDLAIVRNLTRQTATLLENDRLRAMVKEAEQKSVAPVAPSSGRGLQKAQSIVRSLHQTAQAVNTSRDLDQALHRTLDAILQVLPYTGAVVMLRRDKSFYLVASTGLTSADEQFLQTLTPASYPPILRALRQSHARINTQEDPSQEIPRLTNRMAIAPLNARGETIGLLLLLKAQTDTFDALDTASLDAFANHVAMAIANYRLIQETERRLRELAFLNESGQAITSTLNLDRVLHLLLDKVRDLLNVDAASIALRDKETEELVFEAAVGSRAQDVLDVRLKPGQGIAGWVAETGKPLVVHDVQKDSRFFADIDRQIGMTTQAILCVPIVLKGQVVGVIETLNPSKAAFDEQSVELLSALAGLAATAIDNARLFAQVRSVEARYAGLFEDNANPILITDLQGIIIDANRKACQLLNQPKESLKNTNLIHVRSANGTLDFAPPYSKVLAGNDTVFQTEILSNGKRTTVEITAKQVPLKGTTLIQWMGRDISAEIELEKTREDLMRMIIHDLRNPLANIVNSLDVLYEVVTDKDTTISPIELLDIAKRSSQRLQNLISSILDISWLETGEAIISTQPTALVPVLEEAILFVEPQSNIREITIETDLAPNLPPVRIDRDMILRVVLNLLDNAIKFTQTGGHVHLKVTRDDSIVHTSLTDNGPGIPEDKLQSIFEKFVRVREENGPKGTGLGLAFCRLAIKAHGGEIWAESQVGEGASFHFTLPIAPTLSN